MEVARTAGQLSNYEHLHPVSVIKGYIFITLHNWSLWLFIRTPNPPWQTKVAFYPERYSKRGVLAGQKKPSPHFFSGIKTQCCLTGHNFLVLFCNVWATLRPIFSQMLLLHLPESMIFFFCHTRNSFDKIKGGIFWEEIFSYLFTQQSFCLLSFHQSILKFGWQGLGI